MKKITPEIFKKIYRPPKDSHKGQNGKLTIIGGSKLFHGASLWSLKIASRIVDMVFYSTVKENQKLVENLKTKIFDFIFVPRQKIEDYIKQSDAVLIGPGMVRGDKNYTGTGESGEETKKLTQKLLFSFPEKKWVIDAGSLHVMEKDWLKKLSQAMITPHIKEFTNLFGIKTKERNITKNNLKFWQRLCQKISGQYGVIIVLKGKLDLVCSPQDCFYNLTGNEGMTKGGTGDVLAGLIASLTCKNDLFLSGCAGVYLNGLAADILYQKVGPYFNASDLCDQVPKTFKKLMNYQNNESFCCR